MKADLAIRIVMVIAAGAAALAGDTDFAASLRAAEALQQQREFAGAEKLLRAVLKETETFGPEDPRRAVVLNNLGSLYHFMNLLSKAEACYRRAMEIEDRSFGNDESRPIRARLNLAALYVETGQADKAERLGLRALLERSPADSRTSPDVARLLAILGAIEQRKGRNAQAEKYLREALTIWDNLAPDSVQAMETLNNLGVLYGDSGRSAEALSCYERALTIAEKTLSPADPLQATLLTNAGTFHFIVHGPAHAEPFYVRALALAERTMGRNHALVGQIMLQYAAVLERTDRTAEAKKCRRRANTIMEDASKGEPARYTVDLSELARRSAKR